MSTRYEWADISPKRAVLYLVDDENPRNKKIAEVFYNEYEKNGFVARLVDNKNPLVTEWVNSAIETKQEAMKIALVALVARRIDKANGIT
jgi:hypothetical protein